MCFKPKPQQRSYVNDISTSDRFATNVTTYCTPRIAADVLRNAEEGEKGLTKWNTRKRCADRSSEKHAKVNEWEAEAPAESAAADNALRFCVRGIPTQRSRSGGRERSVAVEELLLFYGSALFLDREEKPPSFRFQLVEE